MFIFWKQILFKIEILTCWYWLCCIYLDKDRYILIITSESSIRCNLSFSCPLNLLQGIYLLFPLFQSVVKHRKMQHLTIKSCPDTAIQIVIPSYSLVGFHHEILNNKNEKRYTFQIFWLVQTDCD